MHPTICPASPCTAPLRRAAGLVKKRFGHAFTFGHSIVHSTAMRFDLTEHFRRLRRSAGAGPDGCRNEYRTALTAYSLLSSTTPRRLRSCVALTSSPLCWRTLTCRGGSTSLGRDGERIAQGAPAVDGDGASAPAKAAAARFEGYSGAQRLRLRAFWGRLRAAVRWERLTSLATIE